MPEPCPRIGSEDQGLAALKVHDDTHACLPPALEGDSAGWKWRRGGSRIAWLHPSSPVIYKIETAYYGSNETEHGNAQILRDMGKSWAPDTSLYSLGDSPTRIVLAMSYYPVPGKLARRDPG